MPAHLTPYASRTGTRRNLEALRAHGWRLLVSARGVARTEGFPYAIDNGAWTAHQRGEAFDTEAFVRVLDRLGRDADWVVVPDIVAGGRASLDLSLRWLPRVASATARPLIAVQDGIEPSDVEGFCAGGRVGIFVGGTTQYKLATLAIWCGIARRYGAWCHVGRVNSARRIAQCASAGAHSFDGTSASRYAVTIPALTAAARQLAMRFA